MSELPTRITAKPHKQNIGGQTMLAVNTDKGTFTTVQLAQMFGVTMTDIRNKLYQGDINAPDFFGSFLEIKRRKTNHGLDKYARRRYGDKNIMEPTTCNEALRILQSFNRRMAKRGYRVDDILNPQGELYQR